jgi:hypothetical protein
MFIPRQTLGFLIAGVIVAAGGCKRALEPLTPEAASAKGDALLREMSKNLSALQTFAYTADERREVVKGGKKEEKHASRRVTIRRPNGLSFTTTGNERDSAGWYDGKHLTLVSNRSKVWARGPMPGTLDEALDYISSEYAIEMPTADLLYSNPYDAFMTKDTTGGWVDTQKIGDRSCDHVAYRQPAVDWELWVNESTRLPCQMKIVYKNAPLQPSTTIVYSAFDPKPQVSDETFAAKVPDGFQRIKIMRHATVNDPNAAEVPAATSGGPTPKK